MTRRDRELAAARALVARLRPCSPTAWLELPQDEFDRRLAAWNLAARRVEELTRPWLVRGAA